MYVYIYIYIYIHMYVGCLLVDPVRSPQGIVFERSVLAPAAERRSCTSQYRFGSTYP